MQRGEVKNKFDSKLSGCIESKLKNIAGNVFDFFAKSLHSGMVHTKWYKEPLVTFIRISTTTDFAIYDYYNFFLCHSYYG